MGIPLNRKRIAFYNPPDYVFDQRGIQKTNPGIGGTEYICATLIEMLRQKECFETVLYTKNDGFALEKCTCITTTGIDDSIQHFLKGGDAGVFIIVIRKPEDVPTIVPPRIKVVSWCHCEYGRPVLRILKRRHDIHHVFLTASSRALYARYGAIWNNSSIIGNFVDVPDTRAVRLAEKEPIVTYVGALMGFKHADVLTRAWPLVIKRVPEARLHVVGSAYLYGKMGALGKLGVAWPNYERELVYPLEKSGCLNTVVFEGLLTGKERVRLAKRTMIGVVNPVGTTETFCISALEFGALGVPVVGGDRGGLKDTIPVDCGLRIKSYRQLAKSLILLLRDPSMCREIGANYYGFVKQHYTYKTFALQWITFLQSGCMCVDPPSKRVANIFSSWRDEARLFLHRAAHYLFRMRVLRKYRT